jgi:hypothetical protein
VMSSSLTPASLASEMPDARESMFQTLLGMPASSAISRQALLNDCRSGQGNPFACLATGPSFSLILRRHSTTNSHEAIAWTTGCPVFDVLPLYQDHVDAPAMHIDHLEPPAAMDKMISRFRQFMQLRENETGQGYVVAGGGLAHPDQLHHIGELDEGIDQV